MNRTMQTARTAIAMIALACSTLVSAADVAQKPAAPAQPPAVAAPAPAPASPSPAASAAGAAAAPAGTETGLAAVYSDRLQGHKTASGERYDRNLLTAAHKTLPFGTQVKVTSTKNQKSVTVRINDRGPTQAGRILDLSPSAAKALGISPKGMGEVSIAVVAEAPNRGKKP